MKTQQHIFKINRKKQRRRNEELKKLSKKRKMQIKKINIEKIK